jgi:SAM-dependent methyltransferase
MEQVKAERLLSELSRWEGRFATEAYVFGTVPNTFLRNQLEHLRAGSKALSIADGEGRNGVWLSECGLEVTSQDFSPIAQDKALKLAADRGVKISLELSDLMQRIWEPNCYDVVVGIFFQFLSPPNRQHVFSGMLQSLKPGGLLLIEGYGLKQLDYGTGGPKEPQNLYTKEMLHSAFSGCSELTVVAYDAEISEGSGDHGLSALIDVVGQK